MGLPEGELKGKGAEILFGYNGWKWTSLINYINIQIQISQWIWNVKKKTTTRHIIIKVLKDNDRVVNVAREK